MTSTGIRRITGVLLLLMIGVTPGGPALGGSAAVRTSREVTVGGPCEGCEAVFQGQPRAPGATARIAPVGEPGDPMVLEGIVRRMDGTPAAGILVYAYHTDRKGNYPPPADADGEAARRHGRLRGFARTGTDGHYRFETIRPASYPGTTIPQHIHMHVLEPGRCTYYIDEVQFTDDPRLPPTQPREGGRGGNGVMTPTRTPEGTWRVRRDIVLGQGIADYGRCGEATPGR